MKIRQCVDCIFCHGPVSFSGYFGEDGTGLCCHEFCKSYENKSVPLSGCPTSCKTFKNRWILFEGKKAWAN